jgi:hypothetical protein
MRGLIAAFCLVGQGAAADCLVLGDLGYVLSVDPPHDVTAHGRFVTLDLTAASGTFTQVQFFSLAGFGTPERTAPEHVELPNGMTLYYSLGLYEPEGNAGSLADLTVWLDVVAPLGVSCWQQQKVSNPKWCLPILGHLRPAAEGCETIGD